ncbi:hypothetical protein GCK32_003008 [Trichostrongylus colubriformis]|uniref:Uncharacterized protein n=1 Tax=Trichostrongylus colubriformis TaxID=6319 RepID=A0AAN8FJE9_TRICO
MVLKTNQNSLEYMKKLAYDDDSVIVVNNIDSVDESVYQKIAKWLCTSVDTLRQKVKL